MGNDSKFPDNVKGYLCSNFLLDVIITRLFRYPHRVLDYRRWRDVLYIQFIGFSLLFGVLYALWRFDQNLLAFGLILCIIVLGGYASRRIFLSPSSIRQQSRYLELVRFWEKARIKGLLNIARESFYKRPGLAGITASFLTLVCAHTLMIVLNGSLNGPLIDEYAFRNVHATVWVVHATATGFSFTVLIFFWDYLEDNFNKTRQIKVLVRNTKSFHIIYYLICANIFIGFLALVSGQASSKTSIRPNILGTQFILFLLSVLGILLLYNIVYRVMIDRQVFTDSLDRKIKNEIRDILTESEQDIKKEVLINQIYNYPQDRYSYSNEDQIEFTAGELKSSGRIVDIHLHRLNDIFDFSEELNIKAEKVPEIGKIYGKDDNIFIFQGNIDEKRYERLQRMIKRAIKVREG